jgi:hypothetical protein
MKKEEERESLGKLEAPDCWMLAHPQHGVAIRIAVYISHDISYFVNCVRPFFLIVLLSIDSDCCFFVCATMDSDSSPTKKGSKSRGRGRGTSTTASSRGRSRGRGRGKRAVKVLIFCLQSRSFLLTNFDCCFYFGFFLS